MESSSDRFPLTRQSVLHAVRCADATERQRGWARLVEAYW